MNPYEITQEISDNDFENILNETNETVNILGVEFEPGRLIREMDPIWFNCMKLDYESNMDPGYCCSECDSIYDNFDDAEDCCSES